MYARQRLYNEILFRTGPTLRACNALLHSDKLFFRKKQGATATPRHVPVLYILPQTAPRNTRPRLSITNDDSSAQELVLRTSVSLPLGAHQWMPITKNAHPYSHHWMPMLIPRCPLLVAHLWVLTRECQPLDAHPCIPTTVCAPSGCPLLDAHYWVPTMDANHWRPTYWMPITWRPLTGCP